MNMSPIWFTEAYETRLMLDHIFRDSMTHFWVVAQQLRNNTAPNVFSNNGKKQKLILVCKFPECADSIRNLLV